MVKPSWTRGIPHAIAEIIGSEVASIAWRLEPGALELDDLRSIALTTAYANPDAPGALLRIRVRFALRTAFRQEWRAQGRVPRTIRWPVYWPRTFHRPGTPDRKGHRRPYKVIRCQDCRVELERWAKRCKRCAHQHRLEAQRTHNATYYQRKKAKEAA